MQTLDMFLDMDQCIDGNNQTVCCEQGATGVFGLKNSNSFLSLSDISDIVDNNSLHNGFEHNSPNVRESQPAQISTFNTVNSSSDSFSSCGHDAIRAQKNLVSQLFPLFESMLKGLYCSTNNTQSNQFTSTTLPSNLNATTPTQYSNHSSPTMNSIQHQIFQPQQVIYQTFHSSPNVQTHAFNISSPTSTIVNSPPFPHQPYIQFSNMNLVNSGSSDSGSTSCSPTCVKIQKTTQKTKRNAHTKPKIVLCNNEYDEKMFKIRNPNQTYYKFVER